MEAVERHDDAVGDQPRQHGRQAADLLRIVRTIDLAAPPDYDHYVEAQLQPIAEAILRFVPGVDFAALAGLTRQLSLF